MAKYDPDEFFSAERKERKMDDLKCKSCKASCAYARRPETNKHGKCLVGYVPLTNADKIRQMSDEELAERFASACPPKDATNRCCQYYLSGSNGCKDCWLEWLQQEVDK